MNLIEKFKEETKLRAIFEDGMGNLIYTEEYVEWLEEKVKELSKFEENIKIFWNKI